MSNTLLRRLVEIFIGLIVLGWGLEVGRSVNAVLSGNFGTVAWPIVTDSPAGQHLASPGELSWTHGLVRISDQPIAQAIDLFDSLLALLLLVVALLSLRRLLIALAEGKVFTAETVGLLRRIGFALLAICLVSVLDAVLIQSIILQSADMPQGMVLHPSISWSENNVANIWLDYDVPLGTFMLGVLALLMSEAFRAGKSYREDSESVV